MLRTDYTNDILDSSKNTERVYNIKNASGQIVEENIRIEDITEYTQEGSKFGANDINATNQKVNELDANVYATNQKVNELDVNVGNFNLYVGADGKLHWVNKEGADSVLPFSSKFTAVIRVTIQLAYQLNNIGDRAIQESTIRDITVNFDGKNITLSGWNTDWTDNMGNTGNNTRCTLCFHITNVQLISFTML